MAPGHGVTEHFYLHLTQESSVGSQAGLHQNGSRSHPLTHTLLSPVRFLYLPKQPGLPSIPLPSRSLVPPSYVNPSCATREGHSCASIQTFGEAKQRPFLPVRHQGMCQPDSIYHYHRHRKPVFAARAFV